MLEGLESIDWSTKGDKDFTGIAIPITIRKLTSENIVEASNAAAMLIGHTSSVWWIRNLALDTFNFLIEIIQSEQVAHKEVSLNVIKILAETNRHLLGYNAPDAEQETALLLAIKNGLQNNIPVFLKLLKSTNPEVRSVTLDILLTLPENIDQTLPSIVGSLIKHETDDSRKCGILASLTMEFLPGEPKYAYLFQPILDSDESVRVKSRAAGILAGLLGKKAPQKVIDMILEGLKFPDENTVFFGLGRIDSMRSVLEYLKGFEVATTKQQTHQLLKNLLKTIFPISDIVFKRYVHSYVSGDKYIYKSRDDVIRRLEIKELSFYQKDVLEELANQDKAWWLPSDYLELFGLPSTQQELKVFLTQGKNI